jgi:hypothetical protein
MQPDRADRYLLGYTRCVDLNPVRAKMAGRPEDSAWSSYRFGRAADQAS